MIRANNGFGCQENISKCVCVHALECARMCVCILSVSWVIKQLIYQLVIVSSIAGGLGDFTLTFILHRLNLHNNYSNGNYIHKNKCSPKTNKYEVCLAAMDETAESAGGG